MPFKREEGVRVAQAGKPGLESSHPLAIPAPNLPQTTPCAILLGPAELPGDSGMHAELLAVSDSSSIAHKGGAMSAPSQGHLQQWLNKSTTINGL